MRHAHSTADRRPNCAANGIGRHITTVEWEPSQQFREEPERLVFVVTNEYASVQPSVEHFT
jgi:hypothetical protein